MAQAIVDPHELRRFAHQLERFASELESQMLMLRGQVTSLAQTWRDQENEKFAQEFDETLAATNRFMEATRQHIPFLLRKADRVEEYLRQR
ncbi:MAG TPA: WXG100 family type VII secretion target [Pirellulales bacterium]|nr:WXG100 family type VII secretion target [Pirellulales bacterium]